jgi:hypothetical protein
VPAHEHGQTPAGPSGSTGRRSVAQETPFGTKSSAPRSTTERAGAEGADRAHGVPGKADKRREERSPSGRAEEKPQVDQRQGGRASPIPALAVWESLRCLRTPAAGLQANPMVNDGAEHRRSPPAMPGQRSKGGGALTRPTFSRSGQQVAGLATTQTTNMASLVTQRARWTSSLPVGEVYV